MQTPTFRETSAGNPFYRALMPVVLGVVFFGLVAPLALLFRILGKDPLHRRLKPGAPSYWIERKPGSPAPATMKNQF